MVHVTIDQYWMGRDAKYPGELTAEIRHNATDLLGRVNLLLAQAEADGVMPGLSPRGDFVASGWRPTAVNDGTANAAKTSKHLTGDAIDLKDDFGRRVARWCLRNLDALEDAGLWMEDPCWTPSWVHLQRVPPRSNSRVYVPSTAPALSAKLKEQGGTA